MVLTVYILSIAYAIFICWCIIGWLRLPVERYVPLGNNKEHESQQFVSVIIPARNEESNIQQCLEDFLDQDYPKIFFEVIVVDDHSTDETSLLVRKFIEAHPDINIRLIEPGSSTGNNLFKKEAITRGIDIATGSLVITTDADCRRGPGWIGAIANFYQIHHSELISAPVFLESGRSWIEKMQALEFLGLVAIGAAGIRNKLPMLCNGANLAFPRKIFYEVNGYHAKTNIATGDDTQLLMKISLRGKDKIHFIKSAAAAVTTGAQKSVSGLLQQRQRWASKIPFHMNAFTIVIAGIAFFLQLGLLFMAASFLMKGNASDFIFILMIKMIPEFIFLALICRFAKKTRLLNLFLPAQIIYPIYISFVGLTAVLGRHQWKGRIQ